MMPGLYITALVVGVVALVVFFIAFVGLDEALGEKRDNLFLVCFFALVFSLLGFSGFFYGLGLRNGAVNTAKGKYETTYEYDKDGRVTDTLVHWHNL